MMNLLLAILAQDSPAPGGGGGGGGGGFQLWIGILLMIGVFYFVLFRGNPRGRKQRAQMLAEMKKNDRVMTIGGILGTVVTVKDKEIVLKVDETTNAKMTFIKDAIRTVVKEDTELTVQDK
ncbi:MAG: preprotein translocase subunit YajC [Planctomycetota bacterium]|jgi:preprotein translocase subunit YajC